MKVNLDKITLRYSDELGQLKYFKQFNIYKTINIKDVVNIERFLCIKGFRWNLETTVPKFKVISAKIIDTLEGTSLAGQKLTGKKLIIIGEVTLSVIVNCFCNVKKCGSFPIGVSIPFSTFIIIPKDICNVDKVILRYLIEDVSVEKLCENKIIVSVTTLVQYLDEY